MNIEKITYSSWKDFQKCKYYYKIKHIDKVRMPFVGTVNTAFGKAIHYCLEIGIPAKLKREKLDEMFIEFFDNDIKKERIIIPNRDEWIEKSKKILDDFWRFSFPKLKDNVKSAEWKFYLPMLGGKFKIVGIIDHITNTKNGIGVIDYKTGKLKKMERENKMQLRIYSIACEMQFNQVPEWLSLYYVEHNKCLDYFPTKKDNEETIEELIGFYNNIIAMKEEDFEPNLDSCYKFCDHKNHCKHLVGEEDSGIVR